MNRIGLEKNELLGQVDASLTRLGRMEKPVAVAPTILAGLVVMGVGIGYCLGKRSALPTVKVTQYSWIARKEVEVLQYANRKLAAFWFCAAICPGAFIWGTMGVAAGAAVMGLVHLVFEQMESSIQVRRADLDGKYNDRQRIEPKDLKHALYLLDRKSLATLAPQMNFSQLAVYREHVGPRLFKAHLKNHSPASTMWKWLVDLPTRTDIDKMKEEIASYELREAFRDPHFIKAFHELAPPSVKPNSVWLDWREQGHPPFDVTFIVEGREIAANKERLAKHSGYFHQLLGTGFAEGKKDRIPLGVVSYKEAHLFIGVLQGTIPDLTEQLCRDLLGVASYFQNTKLMKSIESYVIAHRERFSDEECFNIVANYHVCDRLKKVLQAELLREGFPVYGLQEDAELIEKCKLDDYQKAVAEELIGRYRRLVQPLMQDLVEPLNQQNQLLQQLLQQQPVQNLRQSAAMSRLTDHQGKLNSAIQDLSQELAQQNLVRAFHPAGEELVEVLRPLRVILKEEAYENLIEGTPINGHNLVALDQYATETADGALKEVCLNFVLENVHELRLSPPWGFANIPEPYGEILYPSCLDTTW